MHKEYGERLKFIASSAAKIPDQETLDLILESEPNPKVRAQMMKILEPHLTFNKPDTFTDTLKAGPTTTIDTPEGLAAIFGTTPDQFRPEPEPEPRLLILDGINDGE